MPLRTFTDNTNRQWILEINVPLRRQVLIDTKFDLFAVVEPEQLARLEDPELLVEVLYSLCAEQADKNGVTPAQFGRSLVGDAIDSASEALMEAIADFFPRRRRTLMRAALAKGTALADQMLSQTLDKIDQLEMKVLSAPPPTSSATSGSSPASSESTPTHVAVD